MDPLHYHSEIALAYQRGKERFGESSAGGLHRFKRTMMLPRVRKVIGALRGFDPASVIDIGSGRGAFLWPLLDAMPELNVTTIELLPHRAADIAAVRAGGIHRLTVTRMDAGRLGFVNDAVDVVTVLEVLEHLRDPSSAAAEAIRVARRAVVATVPSREDDNPGHLRVFDRGSLTRLFQDAGASRVSIDFILNHIVAVATL